MQKQATMTKLKNMLKPYLYSRLVQLGLAVLVVGVALFAHRSFVGESESSGKLGPKPSSANVTSYYAGEIFWSCSQPIEGRWVEGSIGPASNPAWEFIPSSADEAAKYCRVNGVVEYHAALDILQRPDVKKVIDAYDSTLAWVKVLNYQLIEDKDYLNRILPDYADTMIHCIIVVYSPEGERFFLEEKDASDESFYTEILATEFLASLNSASDADVTSFWLNLR